MQRVVQPSLFPEVETEDPRYLTDQLITYIGNKRSLLPFLGGAVATVSRRLGGRPLACADLFAGTGIVARFLKQHCRLLIVNDLEGYSRVANECFLANRSAVPWSDVVAAVDHVERSAMGDRRPGFLCDLYAPKDEANIRPDDRVFYTRRNAIFLDAVLRVMPTLPRHLQRFVLGPLLAQASVHANTSGVFKGFYKNANGVGQFGGSGRDALTRILRDIHVVPPVLSRFESEYEVHQADANELVARLPEVDVAYLDPPYNQHPYGSNYFMLNLLVDNRPPTEVSRVSGIPTDWNRSRYNQRREAEGALFDLIERLPARFVLISHNSEGFISPATFLERLGRCGKVSKMETTYNAFRGSRNLHGRPLHVTESLYLLEK